MWPQIQLPSQSSFFKESNVCLVLIYIIGYPCHITPKVSFAHVLCITFSIFFLSQLFDLSLYVNGLIWKKFFTKKEDPLLTHFDMRSVECVCVWMSVNKTMVDTMNKTEYPKHTHRE